MEQAVRTTQQRAQADTSSQVGRIVGGLVLLIPAAILGIVALLLPTLRTLSLSRQNVRLPGAGGTPVGSANYTRVLNDAVFRAARDFTAQIAIERVLIVALVPLLLALALNEFGRIARLPLRLLFTIPLALFAPVSVALMWSLAYNPQYGLFASGRSVLGDPA
jgi:ABC-type sugar transport system permease subunit